jgi:putative endonuclease
MSKNRETGEIGEYIALKYFNKRGYETISRNWRKPYGEIDIVMRHRDNLVFIEVKTVDRPYTENMVYKLEDRVHAKKRKRLARVVQSYLLTTGAMNTPWRFMIAMVYLDGEKRQAHVRVLEEVLV